MNTLMDLNPETRWFVVNFGILLVFIGGLDYGLYPLQFLGEIAYWAVSFMAIFMGLLYCAVQRLVEEGDKDVIFTSAEEVREARLDPSPLRLVLDKKLIDIGINPSVPTWLDLAYNIGVIGLMVFHGYIWLPFFYLLHIFGLLKIKKSADTIAGYYPEVFYNEGDNNGEESQEISQ